VRLIFARHAWDDYLFWQRTNRQTLERINQLIRDIQRSAHVGIGKPERLRGNLAGYWSRRIDTEHRIVYKVQGEDVLIVQLRYHY
jgi:toxin YoeB